MAAEGRAGGARPTYDELETPGERHARLMRLFRSIDADRSGTLTADELRRKLESLAKSGAAGTEAAGRLADGLLARADESGDGLVDAGEFCRFVEAQERDLYALFGQIDASGDGQIEMAELKDALAAKGISVSDKSLSRFVGNLNRDGDATVSWVEFREAFALNPDAVDLVSAFGYYQTLFGAAVAGVEFVPLPPDEAKAEGTRYKYILASSISAAASRTCTAPAERIRVYLSLGGGERKRPKWWTLLTARGRRDFADGVRTTIRTIGRDGGLVRGFWRGNLISVVKVIPEAATRSLALGQTRVMVARMERVDDGMSISPAGRFMAGAMGGLASTSVVYPMDVLRIRMMSNVAKDAAADEAAGSIGRTASAAADARARRFHTLSAPRPRTPPSQRRGISWRALYHSIVHDHPAIHTAQSMLRDGGWRAFYRGFPLALTGIVPYAGINLSVFETLKNGYLNAQATESRPHLVMILGIGCLAGAAAETAVYPLTVLRARMQSQNTVTNPETYSSTWDCFRKLLRTTGPRGFYKGLVPTLAKAAPGVGIGFALFEVAKDMLEIG
ncbi:mitochondrial carrier domain-containing protein [Hyaloraphidium curvatum]|nr:mitochondrial carrier domain-containing protein [Hyaloraphidium curvatum]